MTLAFSPAVARVLGAGATAVAVAVNGAATVAIALFPCNAGCPGAGTSVTDTGHTVAATVAYIALILAPLLAGVTFARRGQRHRAIASATFAIGTAVILAVWIAGALPDHSGVLQRLATTTGDVWFVVAAVWCLRISGRSAAEGRR